MSNTTALVTPGGSGSGNVNAAGALVNHAIVVGRGGVNVATIALLAAGSFPMGQTGADPILGQFVSTADITAQVNTTTGDVGFVFANSVTDDAITVGATTADVITLPLPATPGVYTIVAQVSGFKPVATISGSSFVLTGGVMTNGAAAALMGTPDKIMNFSADGALNTSDANLVVSGNNAIVRVTGVAALTIDWAAELKFTFAS